MYKILNHLFGWDYIYWSNSASSGIAKVIIFPDGTIGYWRYRSTCVFDKITNPYQVIWLTCKPNKYKKYFKINNEQKD